MELRTGKRGKPHITSQQDRQQNQGVYGTGAYILNTGNNLQVEAQSSNEIHIKDGAIMYQGALFTVKVGTYDVVTINNGSQGMKRKDLIVVRYTHDEAKDIENGEWAVIQGTPAETDPEVPEYTEGDIQAGDAVAECPFAVIELDGINVTGVTIIPEVIPEIPEIMKEISELNGNLSNLSSDINNMKSIQTISSGYSAAISLTTLSCVAYKIGRIVCLYGNIRNSNGITTNGEIKVVTLPASIKPLPSYVVLAVLNSTDTDIVTEGIIHKSDNAIYIKSHPGATSVGRSYIHFSGMYVTAS